MAGNSFGSLFRITTFGESHGTALGVVIDGCPSNLQVDLSFLQEELDRRKPGQSSLTSTRSEPESFEILSGIFEGKTTGTPIAIMIRNKDQRSKDYDALKDVYRPSHADYTYEQKYGIRDHRGSGRASARETVARVIGGAFAKLFLKQHGITIQGYVSQVAHLRVPLPYTQLDLSITESNPVRCPHPDTAQAMIELIERIKKEGDSVGGTVSCVIQGIPPGIGEPVFDKLHADLGKAMLSINACKGFDIGSGFDSILLRGSEHNDAFVSVNGQIKTLTNHSGGVQGGISNGEDVYFRCAFKPVSTISKPQQTVSTQHQAEVLEVDGRHDPCVLPRAVVIVEAMAALVVADQLLLYSAYTHNATKS